MPITAAQKEEIQHVIDTLLKATAPRGKRRLAGMFLDLVDRESWPEYYEVIPEPRCLNGISDAFTKSKYKNPLEVYEDLTLVFLNALYYNEEGSQIAKDATTLRALLDSQWKESASLPTPPSSPPAASAQRINRAPVASAPTAMVQRMAKQPIAGPSTPKKRTELLPRSSPQGHPPSSPERPSTPEPDVDVGGTPEPEAVSYETARDGESDAIVRQLERGLPRWEGLADVGWAEDVSMERATAIINAIKEFQDSNNVRLAALLENLPEETAIPDLSFSHPLSLGMIESKVHNRVYESSQAFDKDMCNLFLKARRTYEAQSEAYGHVLHLQRLYNALASPSPPPGPPYVSSTHFASVRAGPGTVRPLHSSDAEGVAGVTTFRVSSKDKTFVEVVHYQGWSIRLADWLHLSNPDDPSRPIVAQVFKCWISDEPSRKGRPGLSVCWYYRPEQTYHPATRQFWDKEVFKTSHFAEHPVEDIIEKIACQFTARHIRGRPRPPFWYPSWPLYVCDSRYNDRERIFVKIKNWNSCVPEEVRKSDEFMPIYPFERIVFPFRFASPFVGENAKRLRGVATGGIGDVLERAEGEKMEGGGTGRKRPKRNAAGQVLPTSSKNEYTDRMGPSRGVFVGSAPAASPAPATSSTTVQQQGVQQYHAPVLQQRGGTDRSLVTALGGAAALGNNASFETLPSETAKHFDRDPESNEVLWFAAPPVDMAHVPGPRYSLAYLHHLAKKRKIAKDQTAGGPVAMDVDAEPSRRTPSGKSMTETINALLVEHGLD